MWVLLTRNISPEAKSEGRWTKLNRKLRMFSTGWRWKDKTWSNPGMRQDSTQQENSNSPKGLHKVDK